MSKKPGSKSSLGLMAFVVLALGGGATYYQHQSVQTAKAKVAELEGQVPSQEELERSLSESHAKLVEYQGKLKHLEASVPDVAYIPTLMKELEQIGKDNGIKVTGVRPAPQAFMQPAAPAQEGKKEKKKEYEEIEIEVKGRGQYDHIKAFLDALQTFPKVLAVKTVSLTPMREMGPNGGRGEIEAVVNVVAYVFPFELHTGNTKPVVKTEQGTQSTQSPVVAEPPVNTASSNVTETHTIAKTGGRK